MLGRHPLVPAPIPTTLRMHSWGARMSHQTQMLPFWFLPLFWLLALNINWINDKYVTYSRDVRRIWASRRPRDRYDSGVGCVPWVIFQGQVVSWYQLRPFPGGPSHILRHLHQHFLSRSWTNSLSQGREYQSRTSASLLCSTRQVLLAATREYWRDAIKSLRRWGDYGKKTIGEHGVHEVRLVVEQEFRLARCIHHLYNFYYKLL